MEESEAQKSAVLNKEDYKPKPQELAVMEAYLDEKKRKPARPVIKVTSEGNKVSIAPDHPELAVAHELGAVPHIRDAFVGFQAHLYAPPATTGV